MNTSANEFEHESEVLPLCWWHMLLPAFCMMLMGAHALRMGDWGVLAGMVLLAGLCFTRFAWARLVCAVVLLLGSLLWVKVGLTLVQVRMGLGADWVRLAAILGGVLVATLGGSLLLMGERAAERFDRHEDTAGSQAVTFLLTLGLLWICREKAAHMVPLLADRFLPGSGVVEMVLVSGYAAVVCRMLLHRRTARKWRARIWGLFSAVFFGQLALGLLGVEKMLMTGALHLPVPALIYAGPIFRGSGFFMAILFTVSVLLVGPAWCSHLCYIGAWDDVMSRRKKGRSVALPAWASKVRIGIAVAVFGAAVGLNILGVSAVAAAGAAAVFGLVGVGVMMAVSSRKGTMTHCTAFCPMGVVSNLLGKISPWRLRISDDCTKCGACMAVCRYGALDEKRLDIGRPGFTCSLCRDCTTVCRHGAMELAFFGMRSEGVTRAFVVTVVSLHAVFLAVARM